MDLTGINQAVAAVNSQTIPELEAAVQRQVDRVPKILGDAINLGMSQASNIAAGLVQALGADIDRIDAILKRAEALAERLDGATATLKLGAKQ